MFVRSDGSVIIDINGNTDGIKKALGNAKKIASTAGKAIVSSLKTIGTAVGAVSASIVAVGTKIVGEYADYEQLVGGVETLFKDSANKIQQYAENAYKTAGMSANDYMETVTGFSASLIQSLGGDTEKAAEYAQMAITDMSDNANKMGTDMEAIQNAYNGFSKSNFTMLDNLKLGYGGTKEEMQRLLADAEKLSGIKFDISSYADIVEAIHVIQENMDIAGTTAKEAEATIRGSIGMLKASFKNLLAGMGNAEADVQKLIDNVIEAFNTVVTNISPIADNIIAALPSAFRKVSDALNSMLPNLLNTVVEAGAETVITLAEGIGDNIGVVTDSAAEIISVLVGTLEELIPTLENIAIELVLSLCDFIADNVTKISEAGVSLITTLADGLINNLPQLIPAIIDIVTKIAEEVLNNIGIIVQTGVDIIKGVVDGLTSKVSVDLIVEAVPKIIEALIKGVMECVSSLVDLGTSIIKSVAEGIENFDVSGTAQKWNDYFYNMGARWHQSLNEGFDSVDNKSYELIYSEIEGSDFLDQIKAQHANFVDELDSEKKKITELNEDWQKSVMNGYAQNAAAGIRTAADDAEESAQTFEKAIAEQDHLLAIHQITEEQYYKNLGDILTEYEDRSSEEWWKIYDEVDKYNQKITESNKKTETNLKKTTGQISDDFKAFYEALKLARAKGDISDDEYISQLKARLNSSAEYNIAAYTSYRNEVTSAENRAADEAARAEEQRQKKLETQREQAAKERLAQQQAAAKAELEQFKADTDKLTAEYKSKLSALQKERDSFKSKLSENVFATETVTDSRTGETKTIGGVVDLQKKITARKALGKYLESLVKKGIPKGMLSELAAMDPDEGLQFAKQLDSMDSNKWQSLAADYNEYEKVNEMVAEQVYGPQIAALNDKYAADMTSLLDTVTDGAASAGAETVKEFIKGVDLSSDEALSQIEDKLNEVSEAINNAISDGSLFDDINAEPVGVSMAKGIANGIISQADVLRKALEKALSSSDIMSRLTAAVDLKAASYTPASTSTVTNISNVTNNNRYMSAGQSGDGTNGITNLTVNLLWKDGAKLAEIVNTANKKLAVSTGG